MIVLKNVEKIYKNQEGLETPALNGISARFGDKGLVFILGKSGSGKTTLLNLMGGIDQPTSGEIIFNGKSCKDFSQSDYDSYRNACVGFIFQEYNLLPDYSVGQNISLALELQGIEFDRSIIEDVLRRMELTDSAGNTLFDRKITELSGGQKQRVAIARALVKNPNVILADEPSGALDSKTGNSIYEILKKISKERLVVVVSHDETSARKYADRIIQIEDGKITDDTEISEEISSDNVTEFKSIKTKLPFKRIFTMGARSLKHKKLRLIISTLLSVFMCVIFGFAFTAATCDEWSAELKMLYDNDVRYVLLREDAYRRAVYRNGKPYKSDFAPSSTLQKQGIEEYFGFAPFVITDATVDEEQSVSVFAHLAQIENLEYDRDNNPYIEMLFNNSHYAMEVNADIAEYADLVSDSRLLNPSACRLPDDFTEIAISDAKADLFMRYGYRDADGNKYTITTPDDLIGKKLGHLTICGVYSTGEDRVALQEQYDKKIYWYDRGANYVDFINGTRIMNLSFVHEGYMLKIYGNKLYEYSDRIRILYFAKLTGNYYADRAFINNKKITYDKTDDVNSYHYTLKFSSIYSELVKSATHIFVKDAFLTVMWVAGSVFALISVLMLMNYLNISIEFRKRELGILRALGATRRDIVSICLVESLIIAAIIFILSLSATIIWSAMVNAYYCVPLFIVGIIPIMSLFLLCFGVAFLATILPVHRIAKRKPVDIINGK